MTEICVYMSYVYHTVESFVPSQDTNELYSSNIFSLLSLKFDSSLDLLITAEYSHI